MAALPLRGPLIRTWTMTPLNFTYKMHFRLKMRENQEFPVDFVGTNAGVTTYIYGVATTAVTQLKLRVTHIVSYRTEYSYHDTPRYLYTSETGWA